MVVSLLLVHNVAGLATKPDYQHGISLLHPLKYPANFKHFEYANPNAPKGGEIICVIPNAKVAAEKLGP